MKRTLYIGVLKAQEEKKDLRVKEFIKKFKHKDLINIIPVSGTKFIIYLKLKKIITNVAKKRQNKRYCLILFSLRLFRVKLIRTTKKFNESKVSSIQSHFFSAHLFISLCFSLPFLFSQRSPFRAESCYLPYYHSVSFLLSQLFETFRFSVASLSLDGQRLFSCLFIFVGRLRPEGQQKTTLG